MHISIIYFVFTILIYASFINSQPYRGAGVPMDDLVAAIATAAMNGAIPFNKINLRNPNRDGRPLRIPILLIKQNDPRLRKFAKNFNEHHVWNEKMRGGVGPNKNFNKQDYFPKPKFPTSGMKVVPAPKVLEFPKDKLNERQPLRGDGQRFRPNDKDIVELPERHPVTDFDRVMERHHNRQHDRPDFDNNDRQNKQQYDNNQRQPELQHERQNERHHERQPDRQHQQNERQYERQPERQYERQSDRQHQQQNENHRERQHERQYEREPERQHERQQERQPERYVDREPEREPAKAQFDDQQDYDDKPYTPPAKTTIRLKSPNVIRHVYGINKDGDTEKATIPPRYLKDMPRPASDSGDKYKNPLLSLPPISEILPPRQSTDKYTSEPIVVHKNVNIGEVYRKANVEEETVSSEESSSDDTLDGYAKDDYDKQLVKTLKNLMATSNNRHPLNIGGLGEEDSKSGDHQKSNSNTYSRAVKTSFDSVFKNTKPHSSQPTSYSRDDSFGQSLAQKIKNYDSQQTTSQQNHQLIPQSYSQHSSQSQSSPYSRIPETLLKPLSEQSFISTFNSPPRSFDSYSTQSVGDKFEDSSPSDSGNERNFGYNTNSRSLPSPPLSSFFSDNPKTTSDEHSGDFPNQPVKTYVVSGLYHKQIKGQDKDVEQEEQYDDKEPQNSDIRESYIQPLDKINYQNLESLKNPVYLQLGQNFFFAVGQKGNLMNTITRNNRPSQKVSKNLLTKAQQLDDNKEENISTAGLENDNNNSTETDLNEFSCENRSHGYYADIENNCQIYHQCYLGGSYQFRCPNGTRFDQQRQLCDWPQNVICETLKGQVKNE